MYTDYLHGIADVSVDEDLGPETVANWHLLGSTKPFDQARHYRQLRISLTYRDVLKVSKLGNKLAAFLK